MAAADEWAPSVPDARSGGELFMELLEEAQAAQDSLRRQMDEGDGAEGAYLCVCNLMRHLLEVLTEEVEEAMVVSFVWPQGLSLAICRQHTKHQEHWLQEGPLGRFCGGLNP